MYFFIFYGYNVECEMRSIVMNELASCFKCKASSKIISFYLLVIEFVFFLKLLITYNI